MIKTRSNRTAPLAVLSSAQLGTVRGGEGINNLVQVTQMKANNTNDATTGVMGNAWDAAVGGMLKPTTTTTK